MATLTVCSYHHLFNPIHYNTYSPDHSLRTAPWSYLRSITSTIIYSDGSRIEKKNTAAAAWYEITKHFGALPLGKEIK